MYDIKYVLVPSYMTSVVSLYMYIPPFSLSLFTTVHAKLFQPTQFVCSAPKGFPCWKERWYTDVYCNHIPFQTQVAFCSQCSSVADLLDLTSKQNCTNLPSTVLHTPTPVRAALTSDIINNVWKCSLSEETQLVWEMVNTLCRKSI